MEQTKRFAFLDGTALKLIALLSMVLDHVGDNFFPDQIWMRALGRMAMPLFAFCVAEGYCHTRDRRRYLLRLGLFALISEIPFDLVTAGRVLEFGHQNIMASFFWAVLALLVREALLARLPGKGGKLLSFALLAVFWVASLFLGLDCTMVSVGLVILFVLLHDRPLPLRCALGMGFYLLLRNKGLYLFGLAGFLPLLFYNGERGRGLKWLFYGFYPGHLLLIWLIRSLL